MEEISTLIEMLEKANVKYDVDQSVDDDGGRTLDVYVYDKNNNFAVFEFDAYESSNCLNKFGTLTGFRIIDKI
jgi:hypothetical protein